MAHRINVALSSIPSGSRDLIEFIFFCAVGFTAGSLGLIWLKTFYFIICLFLWFVSGNSFWSSKKLMIVGFNNLNYQSKKFSLFGKSSFFFSYRRINQKQEINNIFLKTLWIKYQLSNHLTITLINVYKIKVSNENK